MVRRSHHFNKKNCINGHANLVAEQLHGFPLSFGNVKKIWGLPGPLWVWRHKKFSPPSKFNVKLSFKFKLNVVHTESQYYTTKSHSVLGECSLSVVHESRVCLPSACQVAAERLPSVHRAWSRENECWNGWKEEAQNFSRSWSCRVWAADTPCRQWELGEHSADRLGGHSPWRALCYGPVYDVVSHGFQHL